ncbi:MAG TPA: hypothetical protein VK306_16280 [Acidimicrobiales bacterium]|nr:hypothetical protein [Acidimicrobiales bacterium]
MFLVLTLAASAVGLWLLTRRPSAPKPAKIDRRPAAVRAARWGRGVRLVAIGLAIMFVLGATSDGCERAGEREPLTPPGSAPPGSARPGSAPPCTAFHVEDCGP